MKWTALLIASIMLLSLCAMGQPSKFSTSTSGGAPTPSTPTSPESLGLQTPTATASSPTPSTQEKSQMLMKSDEQTAYSAAPQGFGATATSPTYKQVITPSGTYAPNSLYVSYAPQTVAGCNLYANLPLWMSTTGSGTIWFYEWYPNGMLDAQYADLFIIPAGTRDGSTRMSQAGTSFSTTATAGAITPTSTSGVLPETGSALTRARIQNPIPIPTTVKAR